MKPLIFLSLLITIITSCSRQEAVEKNVYAWYKSPVIYNLDVEVFKDSDSNGIGDFQGLTSKLDYLESLGVDMIWLAPFQPTPNKDDGYDVSDYYGIDDRLGTEADFQQFMAEAKRRKLRVIMDVVLNHSSLDHPWYQTARKDTNSTKHDWYVWSKERPDDWDEGMGFPEVETETWTYDSIAEKYYFHRFYTHQPDLNFENDDVLEEAKRILSYWLDKGMDGFRLDAVPFIIDLPKTSSADPEHDFDILTQLSSHVKAQKPEAVLLGEANVEPEDNELYFGVNGDGLHMMFNFYANQYLFYGLATGDVSLFEDALEDTKEKPGAAQWAYFLRNHDEVDLGRLSEDQIEEVYSRFGPDTSMRVYDRGIRRRLAPMLNNDMQHLRMAYSLLFSLPGTPVIRYGEEIGMGDDLRLKERLAVRTPMQWSDGKNGGFSTAAETFRPVIGFGDYDYTKLNVQNAEKDPESLLNFIKHLIRLREESPSLVRGQWKVLDSDSENVLIIQYSYDDETLIACHNFSDQAEEFSFASEAAKGTFLELISNKETNFDRQKDKIQVQIEPYGHRWYKAGGI